MDPATQAELARVVDEIEADRAIADVRGVSLTQRLKEHARELERAQRIVAMQLGQVHTTPADEVPGVLDQSCAAMGAVRDAVAALAADLPSGEFFKLTTEEYLHGLISTINEMPRLAMNAVTQGDFERPVRIADMVKQVHGAFQVLNLKNDALRKRFDSLKVRRGLTQYDVKRVEEIVYDVRLRDLHGSTTSRVAAVGSDAAAAQFLAALAGES